ncbi:ankyrin repeat domain-containing protein [Shewanella aestuarii]|uniref:Ankyrin repeat domain-containing protein n=1 Tax=Shewanella aestuarii TaxID=1028752 RepID=A0A6G9QS16_9GAMM|nr:ankyrin repeat domain-containing protein [Shewanella aestuarii]QIR16579.1 ankyrin repeat domain-containing protein [Shewanella aestuarii]
MTIENNHLPLLDHDFLNRCLDDDKVDTEQFKTLITNYDITPYQLNLITAKMCSDGHLDVIKQAAIKGIDINFDNGDFLVNAVIGGHQHIVQYLIEELGAGVQSNKNAALRFASCCDQPDIIKYLLEQGADIHADFDSALYWAITGNRFQSTQILAMAGKFKAACGLDLPVEDWAKTDKMRCHIMALRIDISVAEELDKRCVQTQEAESVDDVSFNNSL